MVLFEIVDISTILVNDNAKAHYSVTKLQPKFQGNFIDVLNI